MIRRVLLLAVFVPAAAAAQPTGMAYQGFLTDDAGAPFDGTVDLFVRLMDAPTGGTEIGSQSFPDTAVDAGTFTLPIAITPADLLAAAELHLEVAVGSAGNVLLPRQRLGSVPFALRCGDVDTLGGLDPTALQASVAASCAPGSAIRAVNADGTVACDSDAGEGGGLASVDPGQGLLGAGPASGSLTLDLDVGSGLGIDAGNNVVAQFGASGSAGTAARADHGHAAYLSRGTSVLCLGTDKAAAVDPATGDVICGVDLDMTLGEGPSGRIVYDAINQTFDLNQFLFLPGSITAGSFDYPPGSPKYGYQALHASDFRPDSSTFPMYMVDWYSGRGFMDPPPGSSTVAAPLNLPDGVLVTHVRVMLTEASEENDGINCTLNAMNLVTGFLEQPGGPTADCGGGFGTCPGLTPADIFPNHIVDNSTYAYSAACYIDAVGPFSDVSLYAYRVEYQYTDLEGP